MSSDRALHQSGIGKGDKEKEKEEEGELEQKEANVGAAVNTARCKIHAKVNAWVKHHP